MWDFELHTISPYFFYLRSFFIFFCHPVQEGTNRMGSLNAEKPSAVPVKMMKTSMSPWRCELDSKENDSDVKHNNSISY
jgi:hypothetical protein